MPIRMALKLCPEAKVIKGDHEQYSKLSNEVTEIIQEKVPLVEKASIDEFYLDLRAWIAFSVNISTTEVAESIKKNTGLPISFAVSANKTVAKIGTGEAKPLGRIEIPNREIQPFLNPLSIKKIPMVGNVTFSFFQESESDT
jgi:DNA polymerase-4